MARIASWFRPRTLLIEAPVKIPPRPDADILAALKGLQFNAGFAWLQARLEMAGRYLASRLQNERHDSMREVDALQVGLQWCHWLQREIAQASAQPDKPTSAPEESIEALFKELDSQIERISTQ